MKTGPISSWELEAGKKTFYRYGTLCAFRGSAKWERCISDERYSRGFQIKAKLKTASRPEAGIWRGPLLFCYFGV